MYRLEVRFEFFLMKAHQRRTKASDKQDYCFVRWNPRDAALSFEPKWKANWGRNSVREDSCYAESNIGRDKDKVGLSPENFFSEATSKVAEVNPADRWRGKILGY